MIYRYNNGTVQILMGAERWGRYRGKLGVYGGRLQQGCVRQTVINEVLEESCGVIDYTRLIERYVYDVQGHSQYRLYFAEFIGPDPAVGFGSI